MSSSISDSEIAPADSAGDTPDSAAAPPDSASRFSRISMLRLYITKMPTTFPA